MRQNPPPGEDARECVNELEGLILDVLDKYAQRHPELNREALVTAVGKAFVDQCVFSYGFDSGFKTAYEVSEVLISMMHLLYKQSSGTVGSEQEH
jgi:hypothetical protein